MVLNILKNISLFPPPLNPFGTNVSLYGLIEKAIFAPDRASKVVAINALDRVLTWGFYSVPMSYRGKRMIAYLDRLGRPEIQPEWVPGLYSRTWWIDEKKDAALKKHRGIIPGQ